MRSVAHRNDELHTDEQNAKVLEDIEDVIADIVSEGVDCRISQRASNEIEGQVEVGLHCGQCKYKKIGERSESYQREKGE